MRCVHCSTPIERKDWFCPNCRRSVAPTHPGRLNPWLLVACAGLAIMLLGGGTLVAVRLMQARRAESRGDGISVTVREAPRTTAAVPVAPASEEKPAEPKPAEKPEPAAPAAAPARPAGRVEPSSAPPKSGGTGQVTVMADPAEKTFVYLNGGTLLGETPLRGVSVPSGRQTLVFWTPARGGRSRRVVDVEPGGSVLVMEQVRQQAGFEEAAGR